MRHSRLLTVAYEDLVDPSKRLAVLRQMVDFSSVQPPVTDEALSCAFTLADNPHIHRSKKAEQNDRVVSIDYAYSNATVVCLMWNFIRRKAAKVGYHPWGGTEC